jgi:hypothetical protein
MRKKRGGKSTYLIVLTPILEKPRTPEWLIENLPKNLPKISENTIYADLHYLSEWNIIKKIGNEYAISSYQEPDKKMEWAIKQLEPIIEKAIKETLWEIPIKRNALIHNELFFDGQENEVMKKYPDIFIFKPISINEAFGKNLINDQNFISEIAIKLGIPPNNQLFQQLLWRCFGKIKILKGSNKF